MRRGVARVLQLAVRTRRRRQTVDQFPPQLPRKPGVHSPPGLLRDLRRTTAATAPAPAPAFAAPLVLLYPGIAVAWLAVQWVRDDWHLRHQQDEQQEALFAQRQLLCGGLDTFIPRSVRSSLQLRWGGGNVAVVASHACSFSHAHTYVKEEGRSKGCVRGCVNADLMQTRAQDIPKKKRSDDQTPASGTTSCMSCWGAHC